MRSICVHRNSRVVLRDWAIREMAAFDGFDIPQSGILINQNAFLSFVALFAGGLLLCRPASPLCIFFGFLSGNGAGVSGSKTVDNELIFP